jgi:hypothetical protein
MQQGEVASNPVDPSIRPETSKPRTLGPGRETRDTEPAGAKQLLAITKCRIHPAIGIARVGDSPEESFIGPERPGRFVAPQPEGKHPKDQDPTGLYKDGAGRIRRQGARFRIFGYDENDNLVQELTDEHADITWTVHLANRKAAAPLFPKTQAGVRNPSESGEERRAKLVIDPGGVSVNGPNVPGTGHRFDAFAFGDTPVYLGELRTDEAGRLVVLGGHGRAESPRNESLGHFANNDGWFDDTSDGPVIAEVRLPGADEVLSVDGADGAWVVVAPPDFAPPVTNIVTLYDIIEQVAFDANWLPVPEEVSFRQDIHPFLSRVAGYQWVDTAANRGHRRGDHTADDTDAVERRGDFRDQALLKLLSNPGDGEDGKYKKARQAVFDRVRRPGASDPNQATARFMPPLSGDGGDRKEGKPKTWLTVTPLQYKRLELWKDGHFTVESAAEAEPSDDDQREPTPTELDRAALENCVGGGFFPGIEVSDRIKERHRYTQLCRLDHGQTKPGQLTEPMAVPWQADFAACEGFWWPAQRPDQVITVEDYHAVVGALPKPKRTGPFADTLAFPRRRWARGVEPDSRYRDMVDNWSKLGFVIPTPGPEAVLTESERDPCLECRDRDYFHIMLNLAEHPEFRPTAKVLARRFLAKARDRVDHDEELDSELHLFSYDERAFQTRLDSIYQYLVDQVAAYDPAATDGTFRSKSDVIERILQFAPLNQTDGEWLRNVAAIREPVEVRELLTKIYEDEVSEGDREYNHASIYTRLMSRVGLELPPVASKEYADYPGFLDSAFTVPLLQYVVSEFTEEFLPEILGMTLHFEWESVSLKVIVELFKKYDIDPFFYQLHLAIDNVAEGHGELARRAVRRYLADYHGDELQEQWRRIWDGYVAFRESGTLFADLRAKLRPAPAVLEPVDPQAIEARVIEMIERKKRYGSLNHGRVTTGMSNDLFDDPAHLLCVLRSKKIVVPGAPENSELLKKFEIDGPMYKVFTDEEQQLWRDWIASLPPSNAACPTTPPAGGGGPADGGVSRPTGGGDAGPTAPAAGGQRDGGDGPRHYKRLFLSSPDEAFRADPRRKLHGRGAVQ